MYAGAGYHCTCSKSLSNSCDCYTLLWSTRRCGRWQNGCADWKKNCSKIHNSCCAKRSHSPSHRSSGKNRRAGAGWRNTAPSFHNCNYDRWSRWFRSWSDRTRRSTNDSRCWYRWRPADSAIPMYGCRNQGKYPIRKRRNRGSLSHMFLYIVHNGRNCTHCMLHGLARNGQLQRKFPGTNTFRTTGSCR